MKERERVAWMLTPASLSVEEIIEWTSGMWTIELLEVPMRKNSAMRNNPVFGLGLGLESG
eukprot:33662-Amorphochlora_amoeboformis.AAC.1